MKRNKFLESTIILIIGGFVTKCLGFIIRIVYTRMVGNVAISLYTIVTPTYSLLLTIATLSLPIAISKLIAEEKISSKKILASSSVIILVLNICVISIMFLTSDFIAYNLLKEPRAKYLLIAMSLTFPFVSISSIIKGYFYGKQKMLPHTVSNIIEQIVRLALIYLIIPPLIKKNVIYAVIGLILLSIASETASIITFLCFLPKKFKIKKDELKPDLGTIKNILNISLPTVSSRLIGNIGFFFEPIILTNLLLLNGYSNNYILTQYGTYNAYSISLLTLPSFFVMAISSALIPEISKYYAASDYKMVRRRYKQAIKISALIGLVFSLLILFSRNFLLNLLYETKLGSNYIFVMAPFFVLFYLEGPLVSTLQAIGKSNETMKITLYGILIKLGIMAILSLCHIGMYSLVIAEIINIIFVVFTNIKKIHKFI